MRCLSEAFLLAVTQAAPPSAPLYLTSERELRTGADKEICGGWSRFRAVHQ